MVFKKYSMTASCNNEKDQITMFAVTTLTDRDCVIWHYENNVAMSLSLSQSSPAKQRLTTGDTIVVARCNKGRNSNHNRRADDDALAGEGVERRLSELSRTLTASSSSVSPSVTAPRPSVRLCRSNCSRSHRCRNSRSCVFCSRSRTKSSVSCLICSTSWT